MLGVMVGGCTKGPADDPCLRSGAESAAIKIIDVRTTQSTILLRFLVVVSHKLDL